MGNPVRIPHVLGVKNLYEISQLGPKVISIYASVYTRIFVVHYPKK